MIVDTVVTLHEQPTPSETSASESSDEAACLRAARDNLEQFAPIYERHLARIYAEWVCLPQMSKYRR